MSKERQITVAVKSASGLTENKNFLGSQATVYVKICVDEDSDRVVAKTKSVNGHPNPVWNETFRLKKEALFVRGSPPRTLSFFVMGDVLGSDNQLGVVNVPFEQIMNSSTSLEGPRRFANGPGQLEIAVATRSQLASSIAGIFGGDQSGANKEESSGKYGTIGTIAAGAAVGVAAAGLAALAVHEVNEYREEHKERPSNQSGGGYGASGSKKTQLDGPQHAGGYDTRASTHGYNADYGQGRQGSTQPGTGYGESQHKISEYGPSHGDTTYDAGQAGGYKPEYGEIEAGAGVGVAGAYAAGHAGHQGESYGGTDKYEGYGAGGEDNYEQSGRSRYGDGGPGGAGYGGHGSVSQGTYESTGQGIYGNDGQGGYGKQVQAYHDSDGHGRRGGQERYGYDGQGEYRGTSHDIQTGYGGRHEGEQLGQGGHRDANRKLGGQGSWWDNDSNSSIDEEQERRHFESRFAPTQYEESARVDERGRNGHRYGGDGDQDRAYDRHIAQVYQEEERQARENGEHY